MNLNHETSNPLTEAERNILRHISRWGSDGYPIRKLTGRNPRWVWDEMYGVKGAPVVYKTKREAVTAFEDYLDVLRAKLAGRL
jgi:hypothetical protein